MSFDCHIDCQLEYEVCAASTFVFKIEAALAPDQRLRNELLTTSPCLPLERHTDVLGNRTLRVNVLPGLFSIRYQADASVIDRPRPTCGREIPVAELPLDVLPYLRGSRYVESDVIFHDALSWIGVNPCGHVRVQRICEWVRAHIKYQIGTSLPHGTARDVLRERTGVCRDYAHVSIALCRALNIPARFVVGHCHWNDPPPDFHALFEAYLDGQWVLFDPTAMADPAHIVRIGTGMDAADLPFCTIFGSARMTRMAPEVYRREMSMALAA